AVVLYRFSPQCEACVQRLVSATPFWQGHPKAPEDWRSPKPGGSAYGLDPREASWSAVVLYRFSDLWRAPTAVVSAVFFASPSQSARGLARSKTWRPRLRPRFSRSVLDCGSPSAFAARHSAASARRRLPLSSTGQWLLKTFPNFFGQLRRRFPP